MEGSLVADRWALWRLAMPPSALLVALLLGDAYTAPEKGSQFGLAWAAVAAAMLAAGGESLAVSRWIAVGGGGLSLLFVAALRLLFPPLAGRAQGAMGPSPGFTTTRTEGKPMRWGEYAAVVLIGVLLLALYGLANL